MMICPTFHGRMVPCNHQEDDEEEDDGNSNNNDDAQSIGLTRN